MNVLIVLGASVNLYLWVLWKGPPFSYSPKLVLLKIFALLSIPICKRRVRRTRERIRRIPFLRFGFSRRKKRATHGDKDKNLGCSTQVGKNAIR